VISQEKREPVYAPPTKKTPVKEGKKNHDFLTGKKKKRGKPGRSCGGNQKTKSGRRARKTPPSGGKKNGLSKKGKCLSPDQKGGKDSQKSRGAGEEAGNKTKQPKGG